MAPWYCCTTLLLKSEMQSVVYSMRKRRLLNNLGRRCFGPTTVDSFIQRIDNAAALTARLLSALAWFLGAFSHVL